MKPSDVYDRHVRLGPTRENVMRHIALCLCCTLIAAVPAAAVEFLGVDLCVGSVDTSVVLPVGSPFSLESAEIGRYGGLLLLFKADNGDVMDHIDNLMAFYTDTRGTGDCQETAVDGQRDHGLRPAHQEGLRRPRSQHHR